MAGASEGEERHLPSWLACEQAYDPPVERDRYLRRSMLSITGVLAQLRLDGGRAHRFSPSAPVKLAFGLLAILLVSLSRNFAFTALMAALVLVRAALLPAPALKRTVAVAAGAAALTFVLMLPAALIGQPQSAVLVAAKVLISVSLVMTVALTTPHHELTGALRAFHVPALFVMTFDLALKNIVRLGQVSLEVLTALTVRSVGRNARKGDAIGGVGGVVLLKSSEAAVQAFDAMTCRGFDGDYRLPRKRWLRAADAAWVVLLLLVVAAFLYLEGAM